MIVFDPYLMGITDVLAFIGWMGIFIHLRRWPHCRPLAPIVFMVAAYRLWEGRMMLQTSGVQPWIYNLDMIMRALIPLAGAFYLKRTQEKYTLVDRIVK